MGWSGLLVICVIRSDGLIKAGRKTLSTFVDHTYWSFYYLLYRVLLPARQQRREKRGARAVFSGSDGQAG